MTLTRMLTYSRPRAGRKEEDQVSNVTKTLLNTASHQPCGCPACDDGIQQGHFACSEAAPVLVQLEREGFLSRHFNGTSWVWERTNKQLPSERLR